MALPLRAPTSLLLLPVALLLGACPGDEPGDSTDDTGDTDTGETDTGDTGETGDTDTGETGDTDTGETGDTDTGETGDTGDTGDPGDDYTLYVGELHNHSGLSFDGCEDPDNLCLPRGDRPGADTFDHGAAFGLDFQANTEHSEHSRYRRIDTGLQIELWAESEARVQAPRTDGLLPVLGYEYKSPGGHRSVVFDTESACTELIAVGDASSTSKGGLGLEFYEAAPSSGFTTEAEFVAGMQAALELPACAGTRYASWFHHPAYSIPDRVDWADDGNRNPYDRVVEIASSHGSSECVDLEAEGCDFLVNTPRYDNGGSVQRALQLGHRLGFVGGTDNHEGRPELTEESVPGAVASFYDADGDGEADDARRQFTQGALTGAYVRGPLTREALLDAIEGRNTLAATWRVEGLRLHAVDATGHVWLPGADVPADAGPLTLVYSLDDARITEAWVELVDPMTEAVTRDATFTVGPGEIRYARVRAWMGDTEHRAWASPWFGE